MKEEEQVRRAANSGGTIDVVDISESVLIPQRIEKFWASTQNKEGLQVLARDIALRDVDSVVASGTVVNEEVQPAKAQNNRRSEIEVSELSNWKAEVDCRLISHIAWAVDNGSKRIDEIHPRIYQQMSGTGEHRRKIPLQAL